MSLIDFQNGFVVGYASGKVVHVSDKKEQVGTAKYCTNGTFVLTPDINKVFSKVIVTTEVCPPIVDMSLNNLVTIRGTTNLSPEGTVTRLLPNADRMYTHFGVDKDTYPHLLIEQRGNTAGLYFFVNRVWNTKGYYTFDKVHILNVTLTSATNILAIMEACELLDNATVPDTPSLDVDSVEFIDATYYANFDPTELGYTFGDRCTILE